MRQSEEASRKIHEYRRMVETGRRIRRHRRAMGMTADDFGDRVGMDRMQVIRIEAGLDPISESQLQIIAGALGVDASEVKPADAAD